MVKFDSKGERSDVEILIKRIDSSHYYASSNGESSVSEITFHCLYSPSPPAADLMLCLGKGALVLVAKY